MSPKTHRAYLRIICAGYGVHLSRTAGGSWAASAILRPAMGESCATLSISGRGGSPEEAIQDLYASFSIGINALTSLSDMTGPRDGKFTFHLRGNHPPDGQEAAPRSNINRRWTDGQTN